MTDNTNQYRLWTYAWIHESGGNIYVKYGDHRGNTYQDVVDYIVTAQNKTRGAFTLDKIIGIWDMTSHAISIDKKFDPTLGSTVYRRHYDNHIRALMPLKCKSITVNTGSTERKSLELHRIPSTYIDGNPNWLADIAYEFDAVHKKLLHGSITPVLKSYVGRDFLTNSFDKVATANKHLLAAATGAGKEASTLAILIHLHNIKHYTNDKLMVAVATIPSTISEMLTELATVSGIVVGKYGFIDYSVIKPYVTRQWYDAYKVSCNTETRHFLYSKRVVIVDSVSDIPLFHEEGIVPILFGSYHDISQKADNRLNPRYTGLESRIAVLSIGEAHQMLSKSDNKMWKNMGKAYGDDCFKLFITGTPYDFIYSNTGAEYFSTEERTLFTRTDVYNDKRLNPTGDFKDYPDYNLYQIDVAHVITELKKDPSWINDSDGFTWKKLFSFDVVNNKFTYEQSIISIFRQLFNPATAFAENGNSLSVYNAPDLCEKATQHIMVALPSGTKAASASTYIGKLKELLINNNVFNGTIYESYGDDLGERKSEIASATGRTLTLTCIKDCTGANIPELGSFVFLRNIGDSIKFFEQATGRIGRVSPGKVNCGVFIGDLEASINIMLTVEEKIAIENGGEKSHAEIVATFFNNINVFMIDGAKWARVDVASFSDILEKLSARGNYGINQCIMSNAGAPVDFALRFNNTSIRESETLIISRNGNDDAKTAGITKQWKDPSVDNDMNSNNNIDWTNMKLKFVAACRILAITNDITTVKDCVQLVSDAIIDNNTNILRIIGKGVSYFPLVMSDVNQIDIGFTNRWIQKMVDNLQNPNDIMGMLSDPIYQTDSCFIAEPIEVITNIVTKVLLELIDEKRDIASLTFFDPCGGRGAFITSLFDVADQLGVRISPENVYYNDIDPTLVDVFRGIAKHTGLNIPEKNISNYDFLKKEFKEMKKFTAILINPPYVGAKELHQQFFNLNVEMLEENGKLVSLHPATPFFNKKEKKGKHEAIMINNLNTYESVVEFYNPEIFTNARLQNSVAATYLNKRPSNIGLSNITYRNGMSFSDVKFEDINITELPPKIYNSMLNKYKKYIAAHGCLQDILSTDTSVFKASMPKIRGTRAGVSDDFFTMFPKVEKDSLAYLNNNFKDFGLQCNDLSEVGYIYDYLKSFVARMGLSFTKYNQHLESGELKTVPLINFDKKYTDQELYELLELNSEEIEAINSVISNYYDR